MGRQAPVPEVGVGRQDAPWPMARVAYEARAPVLLEAAGRGGQPVAAGAQRLARRRERALFGTFVEIKFWAPLEYKLLSKFE